MRQAPRILVCAATRAEHDACNRGILASGRRGHEMLVTGVGPKRAAASLAERLARRPRPDLVVSSGFAGALSARLPLSSWITGVRIGEWDGVARIPVDGVAVAEGPPGLLRCDVLSTSSLDASRITAIDAEAPVVVDMESAALAREAARSGVAFAVVRMISDSPAHPLPAFLAPVAAALAATTARARLAFAARAVCEALKTPRDVARVLRESATWLRDLEDGWRHFAHWPDHVRR